MAAYLVIVVLLLVSVLALLACQGHQTNLTETPVRSAGPPNPGVAVSGPRSLPPQQQETMIEVTKAVVATSDDPFTVKGSGFQPGEPVVLLLEVNHDWSIVLEGATGAQTVADMAGNFTITFAELGIDPVSRARRVVGDRVLVAMGSDGSRATLRVEVEGPADSSDGRNRGDSSTAPEARRG